MSFSISEAPAGDWQKHTKGFGLKLLKKFGFKERLGANEDGISKSIEVKVRPTGLGKISPSLYILLGLIFILLFDRAWFWRL